MPLNFVGTRSQICEALGYCHDSLHMCTTYRDGRNSVQICFHKQDILYDTMRSGKNTLMLW